jgi:Gpi18-like mannosyltransferase
MPSPHSRHGSESGVHATGPRERAWGVGGNIGARCLIAVAAALLASRVAVLLAAYASGAGLGGLGTRWDSEHFIHVALRGYTGLADAAFAPAYPALIRGLSGLGLPAWGAALLAANLAAALAAVPLCLLYGPRGALAVLAFPTVALYTTAAYSEALALLFTALGLHLWLRERWGAAALALALAALTRYQTALPALALALLAAARRRRGAAAALLGALAVAGAVMAAMHWALLGDPLAYLQAERLWDSGLSWPILGQARWLLDSWFTREPWELAGRRIEPWMWLARNLAFYTLYGLGVYLLARRRRWDEAVWSASILLLVVSLTGVPGVSAPRLLVEAFPAVAVLAEGWRGDTLALYLALSSALTLWAALWHLQAFFA